MESYIALEFFSCTVGAFIPNEAWDILLNYIQEKEE